MVLLGSVGFGCVWFPWVGFGSVGFPWVVFGASPLLPSVLRLFPAALGPLGTAPSREFPIWGNSMGTAQPENPKILESQNPGIWNPGILSCSLGEMQTVHGTRNPRECQESEILGEYWELEIPKILEVTNPWEYWDLKIHGNSGNPWESWESEIHGNPGNPKFLGILGI